MALPRDQVTRGLLAELEAFEALLRSLDGGQWSAPSRCTGWTAADIAGHVVGQMTDVTNFRLEGLGSPEATARQADERRGRPASDLAEELAVATKGVDTLLGAFDDAAWGMPSPGGFDFTLGQGVEALWYDAYLHGDDILHAAGRPSARGDGLVVAVAHVAEVLTGQGAAPATLALDGLPELAVGDGSGRRIGGDPLAFVLAATGRGDPAPLGLPADINIYREV
ncbi:MAG: maleylpyruvate isomerase family mycothiol-dependent enzyme [Acidimicrobiia bacterium]